MNQGPRVIAFAVQTRDGFIARTQSHSTVEWRSKIDAEFFTGFLNNMDESGVIAVGNNTYKAVQARLSKRNCIVFTRSVPSIERRNAKLLYYNPEGTSLASVLNQYRTVVLLGGTETYTFFLKRNLIDEMYLTVEPIDFRKGLRLFEPPEDISKWFYLEWTEPLGDQGTELRHYLRNVARARV